MTETRRARNQACSSRTVNEIAERIYSNGCRGIQLFHTLLSGIRRMKLTWQKRITLAQTRSCHFCHLTPSHNCPEEVTTPGNGRKPNTCWS